MKKSIVTLLIPFATLLLSCGGKEDSCQECVNNKVKGEINDLYVRIPYSGNNDPFLVSSDSSTLETTGYIVCNSELLKDVEPDKILKVSGKTLVSCEAQENELITVGDFEVVDYCHIQGEEIGGEFPFFGVWMVNHISRSDTVLFPPCEGNIPSISFKENISGNSLFPHIVEFNGVANFHIVNFKFEEEDKIQFDDDFIRGAWSPNTQAGRLFGSEFFDIVLNQMSYNTKNNLLTIKSDLNEHSIQLYLYENN